MRHGCSAAPGHSCVEQNVHLGPLWFLYLHYLDRTAALTWHFFLLSSSCRLNRRSYKILSYLLLFESLEPGWQKRHPPSSRKSVSSYLSLFIMPRSFSKRAAQLQVFPRQSWPAQRALAYPRML